MKRTTAGPPGNIEIGLVFILFLIQIFYSREQNDIEGEKCSPNIIPNIALQQKQRKLEEIVQQNPKIPLTVIDPASQEREQRHKSKSGFQRNKKKKIKCFSLNLQSKERRQ